MHFLTSTCTYHRTLHRHATHTTHTHAHRRSTPLPLTCIVATHSPPTNSVPTPQYSAPPVFTGGLSPPAHIIAKEGHSVAVAGMTSMVVSQEQYGSCLHSAACANDEKEPGNVVFKIKTE
jgi:hypothetical protein